MATMKKLYTLPDVQELMDYFGDMLVWDRVLELYNRTTESPYTSLFIIAKDHKLKVVDGRELILHMVDGWRCELDNRILFENDICYYPENSEE